MFLAEPGQKYFPSGRRAQYFQAVQSSWRRKRREIRPNSQVRRVCAVGLGEGAVLIMLSGLDCVARAIGSRSRVLIKIRGVT